MPCIVEGSIHASRIDWDNIPVYCPLCGRRLEWFAWASSAGDFEYPSLVCWGPNRSWARLRQRLQINPEATSAHYRFALPGRKPDRAGAEHWQHFDTRTGKPL